VISDMNKRMHVHIYIHTYIHTYALFSIVTELQAGRPGLDSWQEQG